MISNIQSQKYLSGYAGIIHSEDFVYHSPQPDANISMLIRSENHGDYIEWETEKLPVGYKEETVTFLMLAVIDVNKEDPHRWEMFINDKKYFTITTPEDTLEKKLVWKGEGPGVLVFDVTEVDKYGDLCGYLTLSLPTNLLNPGEPARLKVTCEDADSRTWFMIFKYNAENRLSVMAQNAVIKGESGNTQVLRTEIVYYGLRQKADVTVGEYKFTEDLKFGYNVHYIDIPEILKETVFPVHVSIAGEEFDQQDVVIRPVEKRTVYLIHHSHVDIGYTHVQDKVEKLQWQYLEQSIDLAEKSKDYPEGARFRWNVEVMWAVDSYLKHADPEKRQLFIEAVKKGWIELDAFYANELTGLCHPEELTELTESGRRIAKECDVPLSSAMISDIPGWTWSVVPVLAQSGVKYFSLGTNTGHRIGTTIEKWGDKPFYWVSPSGEERVLCWIHKKGYSTFHTGLGFSTIKNRLEREKISDI